jgi:hypothetical protein
MSEIFALGSPEPPEPGEGGVLPERESTDNSVDQFARHPGKRTVKINYKYPQDLRKCDVLPEIRYKFNTISLMVVPGLDLS